MDDEKNSKSVIKDLGLKWENKILRFYENSRSVETNSLLQVRNKVYKNSSLSWKKYDKYLTPISEILRNKNIKF